MDLEHIKNKINEGNMNAEHKRMLDSLMGKVIVAGHSVNSIRNIIYFGLNVIQWLGDQDFQKFKEEEFFNSYIAYLKYKGNKQSTLENKKMHLKILIAWHFKDDVPVYLAQIKPKKTRRELEENQLLMPSEVKRLVEKADNSRDKAFIITIYESAARIGEILNLRIRDVEFDEQTTMINIRVSKTKKRKVPVFDATPYLAQWINDHPGRDNPESYLFVSLASNYYGNKLWDGTIGHTLRRYAKRAGIKKYIHAHLFRHSRISWWAQVEGLNERDLRILAGWSEKSDMPNNMPNIYLHYGLNQVISKLKSNRGLENEKQLEREKEKEMLKPKICPRCNKLNPVDSLFCNCGMALSVTAQKRIDKIKKQEAELHTAITAKDMQAVDLTGIKDIREAMYQVLKSDPQLIAKLKEITELAQGVTE